MKNLNKNWITEKHIDLEYKRYVLLAWLNEVNHNFDKNILYPFYSELKEHHKQLIFLQESTQSIFEGFTERAKSIDWQSHNIIYEKTIDNDRLMQEIKAIINYSIPQIEHYLNEGRKIYCFIEDHLHIDPIGVIPLYPGEGYLLLKNGNNNQTRVYEYKITLFNKPDDKFKHVQTRYVRSYKKNFINTLESIKSDLIRGNKELPNPATYAVETEMALPVNETFLPIAKRVLVKYVTGDD